MCYSTRSLKCGLLVRVFLLLELEPRGLSMGWIGVKFEVLTASSPASLSRDSGHGGLRRPSAPPLCPHPISPCFHAIFGENKSTQVPLPSYYLHFQFSCVYCVDLGGYGLGFGWIFSWLFGGIALDQVTVLAVVALDMCSSSWRCLYMCL